MGWLNKVLSFTWEGLKKHWVFLVIVAFIFVFGFNSFYAEGFMHDLIHTDLDSSVDFVRSFGTLSVIVLLLLTILEVIIAPITPLVLYIVAGIIWGGLFGGIIVLLGNLIGAGLAFLIARKFGRNYVERKFDKKKMERFDLHSRKYGGIYIFVLRINPFTSSDVFSYMAGLTRMGTVKFLVATGLGLAPSIFLQTYLGRSLVTENSVLTLVFILVGIVYFLAFLYAFWYAFINKFMRK